MNFIYLKNLLRHKWFVFLECFKLGIPLMGIIHDWSKFRPDEFIPYHRFFSVPRHDDGRYYDMDSVIYADFLMAWLKHQRRNKHHWQWWYLIQDEDEPKALPMPHLYRTEMLADWRGAGRAYGNNNTKEWYSKNKDKMMLHPETRAWIEEHL